MKLLRAILTIHQLTLLTVDSSRSAFAFLTSGRRGGHGSGSGSGGGGGTVVEKGMGERMKRMPLVR